MACWDLFGVETLRLGTFRCTFLYQGVATRSGATTREIPAYKTGARPNFACVHNPRTYPPWRTIPQTTQRFVQTLPFRKQPSLSLRLKTASGPPPRVCH
jgi:hypothetical protein